MQDYPPNVTASLESSQSLVVEDEYVVTADKLSETSPRAPREAIMVQIAVIEDKPSTPNSDVSSANASASGEPGIPVPITKLVQKNEAAFLEALEACIRTTHILLIGSLPGELGHFHAISSQGTPISFPAYDDYEDLKQAFWGMNHTTLSNTEVVVRYPSADTCFHTRGKNVSLPRIMAIMQGSKKLSVIYPRHFWYSSSGMYQERLNCHSLICCLLWAREHEALTIYLIDYPPSDFESEFKSAVRPFDVEKGPLSEPPPHTPPDSPYPETWSPIQPYHTHTTKYKVTMVKIRSRDVASMHALHDLVAKPSSIPSPTQGCSMRSSRSPTLVERSVVLDTTEMLAWVTTFNIDKNSRIPWEKPQDLFFRRLRKPELGSEPVRLSQEVMFGFSDVGVDYRAGEGAKGFDWASMRACNKKISDTEVDDDVAPDEEI